MKIVMVGGTWDAGVGKPSGVFESFINGFKACFHEHQFAVFNGGNLTILQNATPDLIPTADVVVWMPHIDNEQPKTVRGLKALNPRMILVTSKRNDTDKYSIADVVAHALACKANLVIEIKTRLGKDDKVRFVGTLLDPLGNAFFEATDNFGVLGMFAACRVEQLQRMTRVGSRQLEGEAPKPPNGVADAFVEVVRNAADRFSDLVPSSKLAKRFLGNASFRCSHGFPSFKEDGVVFVSRRDTDKTALTPDQFVPVRLGEDGYTEYWGEHLPSVDTPVQLRLYQHYPNIRYMLHGHVYVSLGAWTDSVIPCGALQEVDAVIRALPVDETTCNAAVNLLGHGCLLMASDPYHMPLRFYARGCPELQPTSLTLGC
jgi:hypothetical protein